MHRRQVAAHAVSIALHAVGLAVLTHLPQVTRARPAAEREMRVVAIAAPRAADDAEPAPAPRDEAPGVGGDPDLVVGGFTFDVDRIARRRTALFPFVTGDQTFEWLRRSLAGPSGRGFVDPVTAARPRPRPPLHLGDDAMQRIVDKAWSRRDRWKSFDGIRRLIDAYDGDDGDVPPVLRGYLAQNILQPYYDTDIPDPRLWVMLGLSADHVDFIDYITAYARAHPSSRTTTELLFLLDKLVQGNRDSLIALLRVNPEADAAFTRAARRDAFDLLVEIREHYQDVLAARGLLTADDIARRYDAVRLSLLEGIIATTPGGYLANDARYLAGAIDWAAGRRAAAIHRWRGIQPNREDAYFTAYSAVLDEIAVSGADDVDVRRITALLDAERGRWLLWSHDRLRQFGYRFDTY